jgi:hypothetical protein
MTREAIVKELSGVESVGRKEMGKKMKGKGRNGGI